jgi:hypothetical protein
MRARQEAPAGRLAPLGHRRPENRLAKVATVVPSGTTADDVARLVHERRVAEEGDMGRMNRTLVLCCMVGAFLAVGRPPSRCRAAGCPSGQSSNPRRAFPGEDHHD